ncbi:hypothetical protein HUJ04_012269, partial [Dendroctonus ponderosae]
SYNYHIRQYIRRNNSGILILDQIVQNLASTEQYAAPAVLTPVESFTFHPQPSAGSFLQPETQEVNVETSEQPYQNTSQPSASNLTSVLSSFSNYLKFGSSNRQKESIDSDAYTAPAPALLDSFINQDTSNAPPVPLFDPTAPLLQPSQVSIPPPAISGPVNSFRRSELKRPTYAKVPGLSGSTSNNSLPAGNIAPSYFPPAIPPPVVSSIFPPVVPQPSLSPASSTSSIQDVTFALNSQFKPINPQPPSVPAVKPNIPQPQHSTHSINLGPVMDAIPANEALHRPPTETDSNSTLATNIAQTSKTYRPVYHHWFYQNVAEDKISWLPFSTVDSLALEDAFISNDLDPDKVIATDGGRYDVNILRRQKCPVYWKGTVSEVRRCSWFYKNDIDRHYVPYDENIAATLEGEFKIAFELSQWHRKVKLASGETVEFRASNDLVLLPPQSTTDAASQMPIKPKIVKRGMDEFDIDDGEPAKVDHLLLMVHGIGKFCDLRFRTVEESVDEFRDIALQLTQAHYRSACEQGVINRVEILPINWHERLHSNETGVDDQLKKITLPSIPRLRELTNGTILDVLFYTSPMYCQTIISTVGEELNRVYNLFKERNPSFRGGVSIGGHSLGSLIIFDLLAHQHPDDTSDEATREESPKEDTPGSNKTLCRRISYMMGTVDANQPKISYPHLDFKPHTFFALGSPIGMFVTVRGLAQLGEDFCLPTCPSFFNIFHPYDPVAYRIEALINPELAKLKPVLIPHHKGRKRMHLELKETMARVGADLKQKVVDSMKSKWNPFYQFAFFQREEPAAEEKSNEGTPVSLESTSEEGEGVEPEPEPEFIDFNMGQLNNGRRIDYVLQEAPLEIVIDYLSAISSHVCYWRSEDSILMIIKEIYSSLKIETDDKIPQQTMTIVRPPPFPNTQRQLLAAGMKSTSPFCARDDVPQDQTTGFLRKT